MILRKHLPCARHFGLSWTHHKKDYCKKLQEPALVSHHRQRVAGEDTKKRKQTRQSRSTQTKQPKTTQKCTSDQADQQHTSTEREGESSFPTRQETKETRRQRNRSLSVSSLPAPSSQLSVWTELSFSETERIGFRIKEREHKRTQELNASCCTLCLFFSQPLTSSQSALGSVSFSDKVHSRSPTRPRQRPSAVVPPLQCSGC